MKVWIAAGFLLAALSASAQEEAKPELLDEEANRRDHIGLSVGLTAVMPETRATWGRNTITAQPSPGLQFGFSHYWQLHRNWSLETGLTAGVQLVLYKLWLTDSPENSVQEVAGSTILELPLRLTRKVRLSEKVSLVPQAGVCLRSYARYEFSTGHGGGEPTANRFSMNMQFSPNYNFLPCLQLALGSQFTLKKNLFLIRAIVSRNLIPSINMMTGHYLFYEGSAQVGQGTIFSRGHSVTLETSYIFTRGNKPRQ